MIFMLKNLDKFTDNPEKVAVLHNALYAYQQGYHHLIINREDFKHIKDAIEKEGVFNNTQKSMIYNINDELIEINSILNTTNIILIEVNFDDSNNDANKDLDHNHATCAYRYQISYKDIIDNQYLNSPTQLICEDLTDCHIYYELSEILLKKKYRYVNRLQLNLNKLPGGGVNTYRLCKEKIINDNQLVISIVDSDKRSPQDKKGATANYIEDLQKELLGHRHNRIFKLIVLFESELENLFPESIFAFFISKMNQQSNPNLGAIFNQKNTEKYLEYLKFIDLKKDFKVKDIKDRINSDKERENDLANNLEKYLEKLNQDGYPDKEKIKSYLSRDTIELETLKGSDHTEFWEGILQNNALKEESLNLNLKDLLSFIANIIEYKEEHKEECNQITNLLNEDNHRFWEQYAENVLFFGLAKKPFNGIS